MKYLGLFFGVVLLFLPACNDVSKELETSFQKSQTTWTELKKQHGDSYEYQTSVVSWTGTGAITTLKVNNGIVISRTYQVIQQNGINSDTTDVYTETSENLGTNKEGAQISTIDELYEDCISDYLKVDTKKNDVFFEVDKNGIVSTCGYAPNNCMDDCFIGFRISSFKWSK